jgi:hypothetical protein
MNLGMTLLSLLLLPYLVVLLISHSAPRATLHLAAGVAVLIVFVLMNQGVLRSLLAIVANRPYLTLTDAGISVDGGLFDHWFFSWSEIDAMAPTPEFLRTRLRTGDLVAITLRLRERPKKRRLFSSIQHLRYRDHFEFSGYFAPLSDEEVDAVVACFVSKVREHQPSLLTDEEL